MDSSNIASRRRNHGLWLGVCLSIVGAVSYFTVFAKYPALRDFPWVNLPLVLAGWGISLVAVWRAFTRPEVFRGKILGSLGLLVSAAVAGLFVFYVFFLSAWLPDATEAGAAPTRIPDFVLMDHLDRPVQGADLRGSKAVLTFFRGHW